MEPRPGPYRCQSADTSREVEELLFARYRRMTPAQKLDIVQRLNAATQELAVAGLRRQFPTASDHEIRMRLAGRTLGRETVRRLFGFDTGGDSA